MAYATQSDLMPLRLTQKELVQLTDDTNSGEVDASVVSAALEEASGMIDSYCRNRYQTPLQVSDQVKAKTLDIAVYLLFKRRRNTRASELVRQAHDDAMAFLKDVSASKASLDQPSVTQTPQTASTGVQVSQRDQHLRFRERDLEGFV